MARWRMLRRVGLFLIVPALALALSSCHGDQVAAAPQHLVVAAAWNADFADERTSFMLVLDAFTERTGIPVTYTVPASREKFVNDLVADIDAGRGPDVALLPQPGLLRALVGCGE